MEPLDEVDSNTGIFTRKEKTRSASICNKSAITDHVCNENHVLRKPSATATYQVILNTYIVWWNAWMMESNLFHNVLYNPHHVLHQLLPPVKDTVVPCLWIGLVFCYYTLLGQT